MWVPKSVQDFDESAAVIASVGIWENGDKVNFYHVDGAQMRSLPIKGVHCIDMHRGILVLAANENIKIVDAASGRVLRDGLQPNGIASEWNHVAILDNGKYDRNHFPLIYFFVSAQQKLRHLLQQARSVQSR